MDKQKKKRNHKKHTHQKNEKAKEKETTKRRKSPEYSSSSSEEEWVVKSKDVKEINTNRDLWMSMTGKLKTFSKDNVKINREDKNINSYNPSTSNRELNPYWKDGGKGLPSTPGNFSKSNSFIKPHDNDDYYTNQIKGSDTKLIDVHNNIRSYNWQKNHKSGTTKKEDFNEYPQNDSSSPSTSFPIKDKVSEGLYLSDEDMNKLAAKIIKAEIMGNMKLVNELKLKLETAREYRKKNPDVVEHDNKEVLLMTTTNSGNIKPLSKSDWRTETEGDHRRNSGKRKVETHNSKQRVKYFANDDQYNLSQMFQEEKYGTNYNQDAQLAKTTTKHKNPNDELEDIFVDEISKTNNTSKDEEKEKQHAINQYIKLEKSLEGCEYCIDSKLMLKYLIVSCGHKIYMALPAKTSLTKGHCILTTLQHSTCTTSLDEDIWEEIMCYRNLITQFFNYQNKDVVFFETATKLYKFPHMIINCVPLPRDTGDMTSIYFKKAILECESEWSMNKKVIELKGKNIRKAVPKGLPYFWIDFGMDPGFAHVIDDQRLFPQTFAEEIIGGILDLDHRMWKNPKREYGDVQRKKVLEFINEWKPFEAKMKNSK